MLAEPRSMQPRDADARRSVESHAHLVDEYTREYLSINVARLTSEEILERPAWQFVTRGVQVFICNSQRTWFENGWKVGVELLYIEPDSPLKNGNVELYRVNEGRVDRSEDLRHTAARRKC